MVCGVLVSAYAAYAGGGEGPRAPPHFRVGVVAVGPAGGTV